MTPVPIDLPVKPAEAAAVAELIFEHAASGPLDDVLRNRLAGLAAARNLENLAPCFGSLDRDPAQDGAFYLAADGLGGAPVLLNFAPNAVSPNALYPEAKVITRTRTGSGRDVSISAVPFASTDREIVRRYAEKVNPVFLPRPQGSQAAIAAGNRHPEISLPAVFEAYRNILARRGLNMASTSQLSATREMTTDDVIAARDGENPVAAGHTRVSIRHLYHAGLWAAIRAGWREGYNAEADHFIVTGNTPDEVARSVEVTKEAIRHAAGYTKFTTDTSRLFVLEADPRHPAPWPDAKINEKFAALFSAEEQRWILDEFARTFNAGEFSWTVSPAEARRLAVKFGESLKLNEELYDYIRATKAATGLGSAFDFEPSLDEADTLTTPQELIFYMHWLKARGRAAQLVPPNLGFKKRQAYPVALATSPETGVGLRDYAHHKMWPELLPRVEGGFGGGPLAELEHRVRELAAVAAEYQGTLSIHSGSGKQAEVLQAIGKATGSRVNYKISGELQLQLFDVLYEQPEGSAPRAMYDRMVARTEEFAARGVFGAESELAAAYREMGRGSFLGTESRGRVDGNLFLVFWLGNIVGSRDTASPDGDRRFFKEKIDDLPLGLKNEARRRNTQYVMWLAEQLVG